MTASAPDGGDGNGSQTKSGGHDRIRVVIPTTQGPAVIQRITEEDPSVRSVICLGGTSKALPISKDYDAFVREPTGVVQRAVGHSAFRLDVDKPIDDGDSWQLAVFLAHLLKGAGRLAERDEPAARVLWATGTVDRDLGVGPVDKVKQKLDLSGEYLTNLDVPFLAAVPAGTKESYNDASLLPVAKADDLWIHLGPDAATTSADLMVGARDFRKKMRRKVMGWIALAIAAAIFLAEISGYQPEWSRKRQAELAAQNAQVQADPSADPSAAPSAAATPPVIAPPVAADMEPQISPAPEVSAAPATPAAPAASNVPAFDPSAINVSMTAETGAIVLTVRNAGAVPAFIGLVGRIDGAFREYGGDGARFADRTELTLAAGEETSLSVPAPGWVRRDLTGLGIAVIAAERPDGFAGLEPSADSAELEALANALAQSETGGGIRVEIARLPLKAGS